MPASMYQQFGAGFNIFGASSPQNNTFGAGCLQNSGDSFGAAASHSHHALLFHGQMPTNLHINYVNNAAAAIAAVHRGFSSPTNSNLSSSTVDSHLSPCHERFGANSAVSAFADLRRPNSMTNLLVNGAKMSSSNNNNDDRSSSVSSSTITPPTARSVNGGSCRNFGASPTHSGGAELFEERVQVDRRKLEQMITVTRDQILNGRSECLTTAEEFFSHVMTRTSTQITWPTRLKIGAKTKKDPYVKVIGRYCDAQVAKEMILSVLKTRHNRVTLKIDVAFTDHSHIIGRSGRNTQQLMKETGCHIHFPDSNRNPDLEKSNMVSIAGPLQSVEKARRGIRNLAPLVITFEMKDFKTQLSLPELNDHPFVQETSARFNLGVVIRHNRSSGQPYCVVKGSAYQERFIKEAVVNLQEHLMKSTNIHCSTSLEILPTQQTGVIGYDGLNIKVISQMTGAYIHHPRPDSAYNASTFFIQGLVESVLNARRYLIGCLPTSMMFEVSDSVIKDVDIKEMEKLLDLNITLRLRRNGETKQSIAVKGYERQISNIYTARKKLVDVKDEPAVTCLDYDFMSNFDSMCQLYASFPDLFPISFTAMSTLVISPATTTTTLGACPMLSDLSTPIISADSLLAPVFTYPSPSDSISSMMRQSITSGYASFSSSGGSPNTNNNDSSKTITSGSSVNATLSLTASASTDLIGRSGSSNVLASLAADLYSPVPLPPQLPPLVENNLNAGAVSNDCLMTTNNNCSDDKTPTYEDAPLATGLLEAAMKIQEKENAANNWKAPGAERMTKTDYGSQKLLATKAMQEKPVGARVPNDHWSGFGFSRSMPAETLRMNLRKKLKAGSAASAKNDDLKQVKEEDENKDEEDHDEEDKIGPWFMDKKIPMQSSKKCLNSTNYFDFVNFPKNTSAKKDSVGLSVEDLDDLVTLLTKLQLAKYIDTFREQEIDTKTFLTMTDEDLKELGVNTFGARRKMLVVISEIKERRKNSI